MEDKIKELAEDLTEYLIENQVNIKEIDREEIIEYIKVNSTIH